MSNYRGKHRAGDPVMVQRMRPAPNLQKIGTRLNVALPARLPPPTCAWPDPECAAVATVGYACTDHSPIYCEGHAGEIERVDADLGFPNAKTRA